MQTRDNYASEENKCTLFVVILQVKTLIATVCRPQEKNMQILNALWTFIIDNLIWQHFRLELMACMQHLMHIYLFGVSINRMLILQLKIFLSVNLCFHFDSSCNLAFISHFDAVDVRIIQMFTIFIAATPPMYVLLLLKNRILNETLTYQKLNIIKIIYYLASLFSVKFYLPTI